VRAVNLLAAIALFAGLGFAAFDDMITVTIGASHGNEYHGPSPYQWWPQHGIVPGESTDLKHYRVSNVESRSPRDFLLLHDLWTTFRHLLWSQITSAISMAWDFTTKSGGIWDPPEPDVS
jgi:hypothetical protein